MIARVVLGALLLLLGSARAVLATTDDVRALLEQTSERLDRASANEGERAGLIALITESLRAEPSLGAGPWLLEPLETSPPDLNRARTRLQALRSSLGAGDSSDAPVAQRQALQHVLDGPPFQRRDFKDIAPEWLIPLLLFLDWLIPHIGNAIRWPFDRLNEAIRWFAESPAFFPLISLLALGALGSLVLLYRRGLRAALVAESAMSELGVELPPTSAEARERAQLLARAGAFREAAHFVLLSALLWIEEHGQTRFDRAATNWEHLQKLDRQSPVAPPLRQLVNRYDRLWYGQADVTAAEYEELESLAVHVRRAVG